jgi:hypothetical protein
MGLRFEDVASDADIAMAEIEAARARAAALSAELARHIARLERLAVNLRASATPRRSPGAAIAGLRLRMSPEAEAEAHAAARRAGLSLSEFGRRAVAAAVAAAPDPRFLFDATDGHDL